MGFEKLGLSEKVLEGITAAGYENPTPIQEQAVPIIINGKDDRAKNTRCARGVCEKEHCVCLNRKYSDHIRNALNKKGNKKFVDFRWKEEGFKMPVEIRFYSFDGERNRKIPITNLSYKIAIPKESKLVIDPNNWLLFEKEQVN